MGGIKERSLALPKCRHLIHWAEKEYMSEAAHGLNLKPTGLLIYWRWSRGMMGWASAP